MEVAEGGAAPAGSVNTILRDTVLLSWNEDSVHLHPVFAHREAQTSDDGPNRLLATKHTDPHLAP